MPQGNKKAQVNKRYYLRQRGNKPPKETLKNADERMRDYRARRKEMLASTDRSKIPTVAAIYRNIADKSTPLTPHLTIARRQLDTIHGNRSKTLKVAGSSRTAPDSSSTLSQTNFEPAVCPPRHRAFRCVGCRRHVMGFRYICVQCVDCDLCVACEARGAHPDHYVLRIPHPLQLVQARVLIERVYGCLEAEGLLQPLTNININDPRLLIRSVKTEPEVLAPNTPAVEKISDPLAIVKDEPLEDIKIQEHNLEPLPHTLQPTSPTTPVSNGSPSRKRKLSSTSQEMDLIKLPSHVSINAKPTVAENAKSTVAMNANPTVAINAKPTVAMNANPTVAMNANHTVAMNAKPTVAMNANHTVAINAKPTVAMNANPTVAMNANHTVAINAKPTVAMNANPTVAMNAKPTVAMNAKPNFAMNAKPTVVVNANPTVAVKAETLEDEFISDDPLAPDLDSPSPRLSPDVITPQTQKSLEFITS